MKSRSEVTMDRTPKQCHHGGKHRHGSLTAYNADQCRCYPCANAAIEHRQERRKAQAYGTYQPYFVDTQPVRDHIEKLRAVGMGRRTIGELTGVSHRTLADMLKGTRRCTRVNADKILALEPNPDHVAPGTLVDGTGTRRRLQALVAAGWSQQRLAQQLGTTSGHFGECIHGVHPNVEKRTHDAVAALYERLWNTLPPIRAYREKAGITRAKAYAAERGWATAAAWDDDELDNPDARPQGVPTRKAAA